MPLYEYQCDSCGTRFERIQKFSDPPVDACPSCEGPVRKLLSSPAIQFKGSGWYITDYARKSSSNDGNSKPASSDASKGSDSSTTSDAKASTGSTSTGSGGASGSGSGS